MNPMITKVVTGIDAAAAKTVKLLLSVASPTNPVNTTDRLDFMPTANPESFISIRSKTMRLEKNLLSIQVQARQEHTNGNTKCLATGSFTFLFVSTGGPALLSEPSQTQLLVFSDN